MKTQEITAYQRTDFGKQATKRLRKEAQVPCVLYGGKEHLHLHIDMGSLKDLIYTPEVFFVHLRVQEKTYTCIIKEQQFHPVSDMILHIDFLQIFDDKKIQMHIPIRPVGSSPGVAKGGMLLKKLRKLCVKALPTAMPSYIDVNVSALELGKMVKIKDLPKNNYEIQDDPNISVLTIGIPRVLKSQEEGEKPAEDTTEDTK